MMIPAPTQRSASSPTSPLSWLQHEFDRLFELANQNGDDLTAAYPCDVREDEKTITIDAELPGFTRDQVEVTLENGVLNLRAERRDGSEQAEQKGRVHQHERRYTRVERSIILPAAVDESNVQASLADGVLHVELAKSPEAHRGRIPVR